MALPIVSGIYEAFTKPNFEGARLMTLKQFLRLCRETNLIDEILPEHEAKEQYWRASPTGLFGLTLREFELALMYVAKRRRIPVSRCFDQVTLTSMKSIFQAKSEEKKAVESGAQRDMSPLTPRSAHSPKPASKHKPTPWILRTKRSLLKKKYVSMPKGNAYRWVHCPDHLSNTWREFVEFSPEEPRRYRAANDQVLAFLGSRVEGGYMWQEGFNAPEPITAGGD